MEAIVRRTQASHKVHHPVHDTSLDLPTDLCYLGAEYKFFGQGRLSLGYPPDYPPDCPPDCSERVLEICATKNQEFLITMIRAKNEGVTNFEEVQM